VLRELARRFVARLRGDLDPDRLRARGLTLGHNVFIGQGTMFDGACPWLISIGDASTIAPGVKIITHDASTRRHIGYSIVAPVSIGRRVYIGVGAIILPGVTIGDNAIIGAGSVVTRDVDAGMVAVGNPAHTISTTSQYLERHRELMAERPVYSGDGWTFATDAPPENRLRMARELADGHGYVI
jgi:maltose O-acetyltransferase